MFTSRLILVIALAASSAIATIRRVSPDGTADYTSITSAHSAAVDGDTIVVRGDVGSVSAALIISKRLVLIGTGWGCSPTPETNTNWIELAPGASGSVIEGFHVVGGGAHNAILIQPNANNLAFRRCRLTTGIVPAGGSASFEDCVFEIGSGYSVQIEGAAPVTFSNSVFMSSGTNLHLFTGGAPSVSVQNCVFFGLGIDGGSGSSVLNIDHCIFRNTGGWNGSIAGTVGSSYNVITSTMTSFPGTNNITIGTHPFVSFDGAYTPCSSDDLHLTVASGLIDAGDPSAPHDRDSSRRDPGIYGGPNEFVDSGAPEFPFLTYMIVPPNVPQNGTFEVRTIGRVGRGQ